VSTPGTRGDKGGTRLSTAGTGKGGTRLSRGGGAVTDGGGRQRAGAAPQDIGNKGTAGAAGSEAGRRGGAGAAGGEAGRRGGAGAAGGEAGRRGGAGAAGGEAGRRGEAGAGASGDTTAHGSDGKSTRDRILDVALDLFAEEGYDQTSLRQIADRMGFTKAALYYHFPSKTDMLMALHLRMHGLIDEPMALLGDDRVSTQQWEAFLNAFIDKMLSNRKLFMVHRVNQKAFANMHDEDHVGTHVDLEERARKLFSDPSISPVMRLKMAAAFAVAFVTPLMGGTLFLGEDTEEHLGVTLRHVVHSVLFAGDSAPGQ
jgi:AcrR family transcriptional regulator